MQYGDLNTNFGSDLNLSTTGDLAIVTGLELSNQRILRRLLTNILDYVWHPDFGTGIRQDIGVALSSDELSSIESIIKSQILLEDTVASNPVPVIIFNVIPEGLFCQINYTYTPTKQNVVLSFPITLVQQ